MKSLSRVVLCLMLAVCSAFSSAAAGEPPAAATDVQPTIDRGLDFLAKDALAWKAKHNCASCHHAALVAWALHEAKSRGHAVDETVLADMTQWLASAGSGKTSLPRPEGIPKAMNTKPIYFALGLATEAQPSEASRKGLELLLQTIKEDQTENGSWNSWPDTRPPMFGHSDETFTAYATLALLPQAAAGDEAAVAARDRGLKWLAEHETTGDHQAMALRLMVAAKAGRPGEETQPLVKRLVDSQKPDGGWSQTPEMASDAHATGQALYALSLAGLKSDDSAIQRGRDFLIKTQQADGSWPMTSRPTKPGDAGSTSLIPITGAGSSWGVLGLVRSGTR